MKELLLIAVCLLPWGVMIILLHWISRYWEMRKVLFPVGCKELADTLLKENALNYRVVCEAKTAGRCDFKHKTIHLSYGEDKKHLAAVFQAAHETGHAVRGPSLLTRILPVFWGLYMLWLLLCFVVGFVWDEAAWLVIALPMAALFGIRTVDSWFDELGATRFARTVLDRLTPGKTEKLAIRIHFAAYCLTHIVLPVSFSLALLICGRIFWQLGLDWGG
ncbi:zinc metallopeptidase [Desulfallas sp. Bu1-1]|uniref:zinc metallopeptidase n=1 Tax=Desulfallas sp. Bu1-1 TaxID=2787620 RepID=UPI00189CC32D|nr:zinc metallopeptidase [Desulfallas sp. Bu1-1]MBF7082411.1 zinc metallopeptidase [Desulfallas sp. Bu1-1]